MPARAYAPVPAAAPRRPRTATADAPARSRSRSAAQEARCQALFLAFSAVLLTVSVFALVRVTLSVRVYEASIDAVRLRDRIEDEQKLGDRLEADRSALATPSRIESIAVASMRMTRPRDVRYLTVSGDRKGPSADAPRPATAAPPLKADAGTPGLRGFAALVARLAGAGVLQSAGVGAGR